MPPFICKLLILFGRDRPLTAVDWQEIVEPGVESKAKI